MPNAWRRFREKLRQVPPVDDLDGSEILPIVHGDLTRSIRLDQIVALGMDPTKINLPPATPPAGTVSAFYGSAPPGWLPCDGRAVSRTEFAALFAVTGTIHGKGDGATTFNLPNLKSNLATGKLPEPTWMIAI